MTSSAGCDPAFPTNPDGGVAVNCSRPQRTSCEIRGQPSFRTVPGQRLAHPESCVSLRYPSRKTPQGHLIAQCDRSDIQGIQTISAPENNGHRCDTRVFATGPAHRILDYQRCDDPGWHSFEVVGLEDDNERSGRISRRAAMYTELGGWDQRLCVSSDRFPCCSYKAVNASIVCSVRRCSASSLDCRC